MEVLTTKEINKKHSPRPAGEAETGSRVERTHGKTAAGGPSEAAAGGVAVPHWSADKPGGTAGE